MAARNGNLWARLAAWFTSIAHLRAPGFRWGVLAILAIVWLWAGYTGWRLQDGANEAVSDREAWYRTLGALTVQDGYRSVPNDYLEIARFAGLAVPLVGLLFAFSGQLGLSLARLFNAGARGHVVIAGEGRAALCLAQDCARHDDVVILIGMGLPDETVWSLRKAGVMVVMGDPASADALRSAKVATASHVVALADDDTANLRIEAAARAVAAKKARRKPLAVHIGMRSPILLQEAREMRQQMQREMDSRPEGPPKSPPVDSRPFSLAEISARLLLHKRGPHLMSMAEAQKQERPHLVLFGFDDFAEAIAVRALMSLWSVRFDDPRITVITPDPEVTANRFDARYPQARAHDIWKADIDFMKLDWTVRSLDEDFLERVQRERGPASAIVVSTGMDAENIALGLGVLRACNAGLADEEGKALWPVAVYLKETSESEFSRQFASGDKTPDIDDAYLEAFGAHEQIATRALILDGSLDSGAAMAHEFYQRGVERRGEMAPRELEAVRKTWGAVSETYRAANRASADHAVMKLWDAGWMPAPDGKKGDAAPVLSEDEVARLAKLEHNRWMAERMLSGWRPGDKRDNRLLVHPNLVPWDALSEADKDKDADQVRGAVTLARAMHMTGFVKRGAVPMSETVQPADE